MAQVGVAVLESLERQLRLLPRIREILWLPSGAYDGIRGERLVRPELENLVLGDGGLEGQVDRSVGPGCCVLDGGGALDRIVEAVAGHEVVEHAQR